MTVLAPIVLASASPRRSRMFQDLGLAFEVVPADIDETMEAGENARSFARRMAEGKGRAVAERLKGLRPLPWIVSADTVVVLGDEVLQKPVDAPDAKKMLGKLRGVTHKVITGWAVGRHGDEFTIRDAETFVTFHELTDTELDDYVATGDGLDKAGAYAIQGIGSFLVDRIDGNYFNVVGLPVSHVVRELKRRGALLRYPTP